MAHRTVGVGQTIRLSGTATTSSAFTVQSNVLRVVASDGNAYVAIGTDPVATATDYLVTSSQPETLAMLKMSQRVVGITTGTTTVLEAPEGTQMPFGVGDRVTLEASNVSDAQYTTDLAHVAVASVDTTASFDGTFQTKVTLTANTAGIVTAFTSNDARLISSVKVAAISYGTGGSIHVQPVQTTGIA